MHVKIVEIRDRATFVPAIAIKMSPDNTMQQYLLRRSGYWGDGTACICVAALSGHDKLHADGYDRVDRTMKIAHVWIQENWDAIEDGDVIDVEFILKEKDTVSISERIICPLS